MLLLRQYIMLRTEIKLNLEYNTENTVQELWHYVILGCASVLNNNTAWDIVLQFRKLSRGDTETHVGYALFKWKGHIYLPTWNKDRLWDFTKIVTKIKT